MRSDHELLAAIYVRFCKLLYIDYMRGVRALSTAATSISCGEYRQWRAVPRFTFPIDGYQVQELATLWNCSQEYVEFLLVNAIANQVAYQRTHRAS